MRLQRLSLQQFRNYDALDVDLSCGMLHLFVGENGSGKTNILEALSLLSFGASVRGAEDEALVSSGCGHYRVRCQARSDAAQDTALEVVCELTPRRRKAGFLNDVRVGASGLIGRLPAVLFLPEDMQLFAGPPADRRRFLDQLLSQVSPAYYAALQEHQRILRQRNVLLRDVAAGKAAPSQLDVWDAALVGPAAAITAARLALVETLNLSLPRELGALGLSVGTAELCYRRKGDARAIDTLTAELRALLHDARDRDVLLQSTSVGPHRDDWSLVADGRDVALYASRGQQRVCMLALLFLQVSYLELQTGECPVILLDDVFSELDDERQRQLVASLGRYQVLLTGTHLPPLLTGATLWRVEHGTVAAASSDALPQRATLSGVA